MVTEVLEGLREQKGNSEVTQILVTTGKSYDLQGWGQKGGAFFAGAHNEQERLHGCP